MRSGVRSDQSSFFSRAKAMTHVSKSMSMKAAKKIDDGGDERQQNLEQKNVGQRYPAESAVARAADGVAMLPDGLQGAERPAETLANQGFDRVGDFGVTDGVFVIENFPAVAANGEGEVSVFGDGVSRKAAARAHGFGAPGADGAGNHGNAIQQIESALFEILAGDVFQGLPAREPAIAIHDFNVAGDGSHAGAGEMADESRNGVGVDDGVGVNGDDDFARGFGKSMIERGGFSVVQLANEADAGIAAEGFEDAVAGLVNGAIVNDDDFELGVTRSERGTNRVHDDSLFVIGGNEHADHGLIVGMIFRRGAKLFGESEKADEKGASADKRDAGDENKGDGQTQPVEQVEDEGIRFGEEMFLIAQRGHHLGASLIEELGNGDEGVALGFQLVNDLREGRDGVAAVAAPVVQHNDVAGKLVNLVENALDDHLRGRRRNAAFFAPIVRVNVAGDKQVAHGLGNGKVGDFLRRFRLFVDAIGRAEQKSLHAKIAFEEPLREIQLEFDLRL